MAKTSTMRRGILSTALWMGYTAGVLLALADPGGAQGTVPNPSFETGLDRPEGWTLSGGQGQWRDGDAADGNRSIAVTGDGEHTNYWRSDPVPLAPSTEYYIRFWARSGTATGGTAISGPVFCNRDLGDVPRAWTRYTSIFFTPEPLDRGCGSGSGA
jgi:hypothetical protein